MEPVLWGAVIALVYAGFWFRKAVAPWVPTKRKQRRRLFEQLPLKPGTRIVDLGCGDGALLYAAADAHPGVHATGYDISFLPLSFGWIKRLTKPRTYRNVSLRYGNLFSAPINEADVVFIYLLNKCYPRLLEKLQRELRPEARVVLEAWPFDDQTPEQVILEEGLMPIYVYRAGDLTLGEAV